MNRNIKLLIMSIILTILILTIYFISIHNNYIKLNSELNKYGYNDYNNLNLLAQRKSLDAMQSKLEEAEPPKDWGDYIVPVEYDLLGNNLKENYRNKDLSIEDKWYIMLLDYKNLTPLIDGKCKNEGDYTYSIEENYYEGLACKIDKYNYSISSESIGSDKDYELSVGITNLETNQTNFVTFFDDKYKISQHKNKEVSDEEVTIWIKSFENYTNLLYNEYLYTIGQ